MGPSLAAVCCGAFDLEVAHAGHVALQLKYGSDYAVHSWPCLFFYGELELKLRVCLYKFKWKLIDDGRMVCTVLEGAN